MSFLQKLKTLADQLVREAAPADPARFGDPLARQIEWTPASGGGANFRTHRLRETAQGRLEFRATGINTLFGLIFVLMGGSALLMFNVLPRTSEDLGYGLDLILPNLVGGTFVGIGIFLLVLARRAIVFDRGCGWFWVGAKPQALDQSPDQRACRLSEIYALQILRERCSSKNGSFDSYELNLVLRGGRRIHVVDHGDAPGLREDSLTLARVLGCKVWDATLPPA